MAEAGGTTIAALVAESDRGHAVTAMMEGTRAVVLKLHAEGRIAGILGLGGGAGTAVGTAAMRALPLGIPKLMVSTLASSDVRGFVGVKDITMMPTIVDVSGLNRISRRIFAQAAGAICGMVDARVPEVADKPLIAASMFGNTTKCVEAARAIIENDGFEVLVFHATGSGGLTMEGLVEAGQIAGVLDVTLTEWADELMGGVMSAGPTRLDAAALTGTPAVVAPGCLDMVCFWAPPTVPEKYREPQHLPSQRQHHARADERRREPGARPHHRRQAEPVGRTGRRLLSDPWPLGRLVARRTVPLARGRRRAARVAEAASQKRHPRPRLRHDHQRSGLRRRDGQRPAGNGARVRS